MENKWTANMPTEPGWYWFYGQRFARKECELAIVHVWQARNTLVYVCGASMMYKLSIASTARIGIALKLHPLTGFLRVYIICFQFSVKRDP